MRKKRGVVFVTAWGIFILLNSFSIFAASKNYEYHIVKKGENIYRIVKSYGLYYDDEMKEMIIKINGLEDEFDLKDGDKLFIPIKGGVWHEVKKGETFWRITWYYKKEYGIREEEIIQANNIQDETKLKVGQRLFIPGAKKVLQIEIPKKVKPEFCWPGEGKIIKYFDGNSSKGIDIVVPGGTTIVASFKGKVSHEGYHSLLGWYLFIYHEDIGFYTCYTHISPVLLVKEGDTVEKREPIAMVGYPEEGDIPYFHFEIRKANNPYKVVDPLQYLPKGIVLSEESDVSTAKP